ncbi:response regulator [uncultured Desulfosarcina sp.]|uniref:response regulator n=1 Tax=uncultured Desulfosarcina sp. TaxID=218289 RepID=UPI0029C817E2|nr:response regulator [uncultured Desulfosarcina sp.]
MEKIVLQSAGSLSVAVLALVMMILQAAFLCKKPRFTLYGWSLGISFSAMLYAIGVFFEYNCPPGPLNQWAGRLEWTAIVFLIHFLYGFTFCYFKINARRYHQIAGCFHLFLMFLIWGTDLLIADRFVARHFTGLPQPYIEPDLGPYGTFFVLYGFLSSLGAITIWLRCKDPGEHYKGACLSGIAIWTLLGIHDGMAALGVPSFQYFMEYGFFVFALLVLWIVISRFYEILSEDKYRTITRFVNDGILVVQNDTAVFENPACRSLLGKSAVGWTIKDFTAMIAENDKERFLEFYETFTDPAVTENSVTVCIERDDGSQSTVEINANVIHYKTGPAVLAVLRDISERIREEEERKRSEEKVARLKKMESLGLLAGGVAHDLNNVLSGIVSYPELLLMELPEDSKLRGPIQTIQESGKRAAAIVSELLTVARGAAIEKEVMNLNRTIEDYVRSPEHKKLMMFHPKVRVETNLETQLLNIKGSPLHFGKAVMNLVSNAAEAIEDRGRVVISTANRSLDHPVKGYGNIPKGDYVVLTVADNGPGMDRETLDRIFEPFYTKKVMGRSGTGLGLTLVWNVVQDHGAYIDIVSSGQGTRFDIYCHVTRELPAGEISPFQIENFTGKGERILVVDDVKSQREITCRILEKMGYTTSSVSSGEAAVEYIREYGVVDLLLLDMIMDPGINGRETYDRIKEIQPDQKAIILSGFAETEEVKRALEAGAAKYIKKPVIISELGQAIKDVLS